mmetsp:Transcript_18193/g.45229  ORF Transcript_18193/g.45229 Transcript_18193/m.45229 type:complete len:247 (-) Transcript_18193:38-778(-)
MSTCQQSSSVGCALSMASGSFSTSVSWYLAPHPKTRARSFPVPRGKMPTGGFSFTSGRSSSACSTHATVPSPPHTSTRRPGTVPTYRVNAACGPSRVRSTTSSGRRSVRRANAAVRCSPLRPPLFPLTKTSRGIGGESASSSRASSASVTASRALSWRRPHSSASAAVTAAVSGVERTVTAERRLRRARTRESDSRERHRPVADDPDEPRQMTWEGDDEVEAHAGVEVVSALWRRVTRVRGGAGEE